MNCKFCEALQTRKQIHEFLSENDKDKELGKYMAEYTVAIVERTWYKKRGKRSCGRTTDYRHRGLGYALNFCPECGRKL